MTFSLETEAEKGIASLAFGYRQYDLALPLLDAHGDEASAALFRRIQEVWSESGAVPSLSHTLGSSNVELAPNRDDVIAVATGLLDAYDRHRDATDRTRRHSLRATVDALYELRAFARTVRVEVATPLRDRRDELLDRPLSSLSLSTTQVNKLKRGGFTTLRSLYAANSSQVCGLCGFSAGQLRRIDELLTGYFGATLSVADLGFRDFVADALRDAFGPSSQVADLDLCAWVASLHRFQSLERGYDIDISHCTWLSDDHPSRFSAYSSVLPWRCAIDALGKVHSFDVSLSELVSAVRSFASVALWSIEFPCVASQSQQIRAGLRSLGLGTLDDLLRHHHNGLPWGLAAFDEILTISGVKSALHNLLSPRARLWCSLIASPAEFQSLQKLL